MATISTGLISRYQPVDIVAMVFPCLAVYHRVGAFEVMACHGIKAVIMSTGHVSHVYLIESFLGGEPERAPHTCTFRWYICDLMFITRRNAGHCGASLSEVPGWFTDSLKPM